METEPSVKIKTQENKLSWSLLFVFMLINLVAKAIILLTNFSGVLLLDTIINIFITYLLYIKSKVGVVLITFALIVGLFSSYNNSQLVTMVMQIILLLVTVPLWIEKFSNK
jgi:hypothetical protein